MSDNFILLAMTKQKIDYLFYHLLDGFKTTHQGLTNIKNDGSISEAEYHDLVVKNSERLNRLVDEFKIVNKLISIFFVGLFIHLQVSSHSVDLRRARRIRGSRPRNETEQLTT